MSEAERHLRAMRSGSPSGDGSEFEGVEGRRGKNGLKISFTGDTTYGRPVATAHAGRVSARSPASV